MNYSKRINKANKIKGKENETQNHINTTKNRI